MDSLYRGLGAVNFGRMTLELPVDSLPEGVDDDLARIELACALFRSGHMSSGYAARIAGMHRVDFWRELAKRKISLWDDEEIIKDLQTEFGNGDK